MAIFGKKNSKHLFEILLPP